MSELYKVKRTLRCVTNGRVIPLAQLNATAARRYGSSGFAVLQLFGAGTFFERLLPREVSIHSPVDGVVTAVGEELVIRTGDGISVAVTIGVSDGCMCRVGGKVRAGEIVWILPRERLLGNGSGGVVTVGFPDLARVTELHVFSGMRKAGQIAAYYKLRPLTDAEK